MQNTVISGDSFLRAKDVVRVTGLSRTTIWRLEKSGKFPRRKTLSVNAVGWRGSEVYAWVDQRNNVETETSGVDQVVGL